VPILHTVLDTNIYRKLNPEAATALSEAERRQSVVALASYYPVLELGARLAHPDDSDYNTIRSAFSSLWHHTHQYNGYHITVPILNDWDSQLAWGLFRIKLPDLRHQADAFGYALGRVGTSDGNTVPTELEPIFASMAERVAEREAKFTSDMEKVVRALDPGSQGWQPHPKDQLARKELLAHLKDESFTRVLARSRVSAAAELATVRVSPKDQERAATEVLKAFPTALMFLQDLLVGMVESGIDFSRSKHANSAWDMALAATASPASSVDRVPTVLVTDDRRFHNAAAKAGHSDFCLRLGRYKELLGNAALWDYSETLPRAAV